MHSKFITELFIYILYKLENALWWKRIMTKYICKSIFVLFTILSLSFVPITTFISFIKTISSTYIKI